MTEPLRSRSADDEQGRRRERDRPPSPEPLPHPVVDNHCHLDIADGDWLATAEAVARAAEVGVRRIVQIGCDLPGAQWAVGRVRASTGPWWPGSRSTRTRRRASWPRDGSRRRWPRSSAWPGSHDKVRAVGETGLDHFRTGPEGRPAQVRVVRAAHRPRQASRQDAGDPRPRRPRRDPRRPRRGGRPGALGHALLLGQPALRPGLSGPRGVAQLRRHGHVQERPTAARRPGCHAAATGSWWRPTRPS